jgi:putative ABC transport system ATP-binding protein
MIELKGVTKVYQMGEVEVYALRDVTCFIKGSEMVSIMGPSGSGKSTLMNILGCLDKPTSGSYKLDGIEVADLDDNELAEIRNKKIGFVFQTFNLIPRTDAIANVELPLIYSSNRSNRHELALQALEQVNLSHRAKHKPSELSGGEQQRVAIARALIQNPAIILADEPTGNLDSRSSQEIMAIFQELNQRQGITVVIVTHDRNVAVRAQRIIQMQDGRISGEERIR